MTRAEVILLYNVITWINFVKTPLDSYSKSLSRLGPFDRREFIPENGY